MFFAHSGNRPDYSDWQLLKVHLVQVAGKAREMARQACPSDARLGLLAHSAGLLHDLGKYRPEFQKMIRGLPVPKEKTYHKQAGAAKAYQARNPMIAFAIAGHHGGLPDAAELAGGVKGDSGLAVAHSVWEHAIGDCPELAGLSLQTPPIVGLEMDVVTRLLFSCLVDADWSDTGEHSRQVKQLPPEPEPPCLEPTTWLQRVLHFIQQKSAACREKSPAIAALREEILAACLEAAEWPSGLFSLTVPTGGGKTLSGLAFALKHAALLQGSGQPRLRRLIYVAPYLSILDCTFRNFLIFRQ